MLITRNGYQKRIATFVKQNSSRVNQSDQQRSLRSYVGLRYLLRVCVCACVCVCVWVGGWV